MTLPNHAKSFYDSLPLLPDGCASLKPPFRSIAYNTLPWKTDLFLLCQTDHERFLSCALTGRQNVTPSLYKESQKLFFFNRQNHLDLALLLLLLLFEMSSYIIRMESMADGWSLPCASKRGMNDRSQWSLPRRTTTKGHSVNIDSFLLKGMGFTPTVLCVWIIDLTHLPRPRSQSQCRVLCFLWLRPSLFRDPIQLGAIYSESAEPWICSVPLSLYF